MVETYTTVGYFLNNTKFLYWINVLTFLLYIIDKSFSVMGCRRIRVPEFWLLALSLVGGTPSAMLAAWIFNHKTGKKSFKNSFNTVVIFQLLIAAIPYLLIKEYRYLYSGLLTPASLMKKNTGALSYYIPFYGMALALYYTVGPLISFMQIIFSPIIFIVNLAVMALRFVFFAGICGIALAILLNVYHSHDLPKAWSQYWKQFLSSVNEMTVDESQ